MELHEHIRQIALDRHIRPAVEGNQSEFSIAIRDLMKEAAAEGISTHQRAPAFCRSIQTKRFLDKNGLQITRVDGPKSGLSTRVVVHYRVAADGEQSHAGLREGTAEERKQRAMTAFDSMRGMLKDEIARFGGAEAFIRWVRSDEDEDVA